MVRNYKRKTKDRWTKEDLLEALIKIKDHNLKINDASQRFGISRATLYRQYQKFISGGAKCDVGQFRTCGGNPILTKVEEDVLEKTILDLRDQGFSVTSSDIKRICYEYCDSNGISNHFNSEKRMASDDWYYGFLKRHIKVRVVKAEEMAEAAAAAAAAEGSKKGRRRKMKGGRKGRGRKRIKAEVEENGDDEEQEDGEEEEVDDENDGQEEEEFDLQEEEPVATDELDGQDEEQEDEHDVPEDEVAGQEDDVNGLDEEHEGQEDELECLEEAEEEMREEDTELVKGDEEGDVNPEDEVDEEGDEDPY